MKKNIWIVIGTFIFCILALLGITYISLNRPGIKESLIDTDYKIEYELWDEDKILTPEELEHDANQLIQIIEDTHPLFLDEPSLRYESAKQRLLAHTNQTMTAGEFQIVVSEYLSSLEDGHTSTQINDEYWLKSDWLYSNEKLWLVEEDKTFEIIRLNGVPTSSYIEIIGTLLPIENDASYKMILEHNGLTQKVLAFGGIQGESIILELSHNNETLYKEVGWNRSYNGKQQYKDSLISGKIIDDVYHIVLRTCTINNSLHQVIEDLETALANGVSKVIIDVRDNPGGNLAACLLLLEAMDMEAPSYGSVRRYSELAQKLIGYVKTDGSLEIEPNLMTARANDDIQLCILTNEKSYSSAMMLAVFAQDGNLGTVIGTPSANSPSSYGDTLPFQLDNSKLIGSVSHKQWMRPDTLASQDLLVPDIWIRPDEDALDVALEYLK